MVKKKKKCKGVKRNVIRNKISFNDYKDVLFSGKEVLRTMNVIRSRQHNLSTEQVNKVALSANDDKRIIGDDKIQILAHGYRTGWQGNRQGDGGTNRAIGEPTGEVWQSDRGGLAKWQGRRHGDRGTDGATGKLTGRQGNRQGDRGGLAKWGKKNKCPLLLSEPNFDFRGPRLL